MSVLIPRFEAPACQGALNQKSSIKAFIILVYIVLSSYSYIKLHLITFPQTDYYLLSNIHNAK